MSNKQNTGEEISRRREEYTKIKNELKRICRQHPNEAVTTMFDYYGFPSNAPRIDCAEQDLYKRMGIIEAAITADIGENNCFFNLKLHEFEALLFSDPSAFRSVCDEVAVREIEQIRAEFLSPEHINNSWDTAPSKRIIKIVPSFQKPMHGAIISEEIGLKAMTENCRHFEAWIAKIKELAQ